jgi:hypothetical protein
MRFSRPGLCCTQKISKTPYRPSGRVLSQFASGIMKFFIHLRGLCPCALGRVRALFFSLSLCIDTRFIGSENTSIGQICFSLFLYQSEKSRIAKNFLCPRMNTASCPESTASSAMVARSPPYEENICFLFQPNGPACVRDTNATFKKRSLILSAQLITSRNTLTDLPS